MAEFPPAGAAARLAAGGQQAASAAARGKESYALYCESCHGGDHAGVAGAGAPTISGIGTRMAYQDFRQILLAGRGRMPSFPTLDEATIGALYYDSSAATLARAPAAAPAPPTSDRPVPSSRLAGRLAASTFPREAAARRRIPKASTPRRSGTTPATASATRTS